MSKYTASCAQEAIERLSCRDPTLKYITLISNPPTDLELGELVDCLLAHPDVVEHVWLDGDRLTDMTGIKLAQYLTASSTIEWLSLSDNHFAEETWLAMAVALCTNSSLQWLDLSDSQAVNQIRIDAAFVEALRLNPDRPAKAKWWLYSSVKNDFKRLKHAADTLGPPSMLSQLRHCDRT